MVSFGIIKLKIIVLTIKLTCSALRAEEKYPGPNDLLYIPWFHSTAGSVTDQRNSDAQM